ncbi:unnamed protein product [Lasius platythorax]|uniref:Uncharacterized protein n=1 Tax=Lasius platythorax TaxID=488582 RepID=A0AAV2NTR8_9HYME
MGFQSAFRLVAGKIRSPPVPECTACLGILAESCKRADSTLSRLDRGKRYGRDRGENGEGARKGKRGGEEDSSRNCISAGVAGSEAKMRKFHCEVCRSRALGHEWVGKLRLLPTTMKPPPHGTAEVIGPRLSFRFVERSVRRRRDAVARYGNSFNARRRR